MKTLQTIVLLLIGVYCLQAQSNSEKEINSMMDAWHKAAATADEDVFFGSMTENCIYLGTDKTEHWQRDELKKWSEKYFQRDKAWAFTSIERQVSIEKKGKYAWFNETLNTQMGVCRGSGVLVKDKKKGWLLEQYNLAVLIDNDKMQDFIALSNSQSVAEDTKKDLKSVVDSLFLALRTSNGEITESIFHTNFRLVRIGEKGLDDATSRLDFISVIGKAHKEMWDEQLQGYQYSVDGKMATVITPYKFYLGKAFSHCGVNVFQLINTESGWKIFQINDTMRKDDCEEGNEELKMKN
ncbi:MAG: thioredoxin-related protein [Bacteroidia bacterium]|jgi:thioredoxin-related protein